MSNAQPRQQDVQVVPAVQSCKFEFVMFVMLRSILRAKQLFMVHPADLLDVPESPW